VFRLGEAAASLVSELRRIVVDPAPTPPRLADLPDPDRVLLGDDLTLLDAALVRLEPDGVIVSVCSTLPSASAAAARLGDVVQVQFSAGEPIGPAGELRLVGRDPVFVAWGPAA
jgi:hypothetical protein